MASNVQITYLDLYTFMHSFSHNFFIFIFCCSHLKYFTVLRWRKTYANADTKTTFRESECARVHNKHLTSNRDKVRNITKIPFFLLCLSFSTQAPSTAYWNCWRKKQSKKLCVVSVKCIPISMVWSCLLQSLL